MRLFSYIVVSDSGFAPNPYHGYCTLACCEPRIRKAASIGDWVIGLTPKRFGHKLVYAMKVQASLSTDDYWRDMRFACKRPDFESEQGSLGDNIYEPMADGTFHQHRSRHSAVDPNLPRKCYTRYTAEENEKAKKRDLSVKRVLVAAEFVYFSTNETVELPPALREALAVGRGHKTYSTPEIFEAWQAFVTTQPRGIQCREPLGPTTRRQCGPLQNATGKTCICR